MSFGKALLASILGTLITGIVMWFLFFLIVGILVSGSRETPIQSGSILKIELRGEVIDKGNGGSPEFDNGFSFLENFSQVGLYETVNAIKHAKTDKNIKGIYLRPGVVQCGWAGLTTLRDALTDFRSSGKFVYAYAEIYTEKSYYLATAADSVFIFNSGFMEFNGLASNPMFYKGMFDKLGIEPRIFRVGAFKSAVEPYMNESMSEPSRRQTMELQRDVWNKFAAQVAAARKITVAEVDSVAEWGVILDDEKALAHKLVDAHRFEDQVVSTMLKKTETESPRYVSLKRYARMHGRAPAGKPKSGKVAVIFAQGQIFDGKMDRNSIGSESLCALLRQAREDTTIKAVVLRINSPGGSAMASDIIHREIVLTKMKKPVIASMGDVAASGGYYIAAPCTRIYAQENTITGSIGVFAVLIGTEKLMKEKVGLSFDRVTTHSHADIGDLNRPMDEYEKGIMQRQVEHIYGDFRRVVMEGRHFPDTAAVDSIAGGRVWSGKQALRLRLVDEIGGLDAAIAKAAATAGLGENYRVITFPKDQSAFDQFMESFNMASVKEEMMPARVKEFYQNIERLSQSIPQNGVYMLMPWTFEME